MEVTLEGWTGSWQRRLEAGWLAVFNNPLVMKKRTRAHNRYNLFRSPELPLDPLAGHFQSLRRTHNDSKLEPQCIAIPIAPFGRYGPVLIAGIDAREEVPPSQGNCRFTRG